MSQLSDNLTTAREALGLSVPQVHAALIDRGIEVAFSTVAGWFNGSRGVRDMKHLIGLCAILQSDLNSIVLGEIEVIEGSIDVSIAREIRDLSDTQREALLAMIRSMKPRR